MKKIFTLNHLSILSILLGGILISNCTSDQNVIGYTDSENQSIAKISSIDIIYDEVSQDIEETEIIEIQVAPNVLNLQNNGVVVTIHTDIPYSNVYASSVSLNGIAIQSWKSDSQGFFVAKFNIDEVKALADLEIGGYNTLTLHGASIDGSFSGSEDILVISKTGK